MKAVFLALCAFVSSIYGDGFIAGTLVKTPTGYRAIESLAIGDTVCCTTVAGTLATTEIIATYQELFPCYCELEIDGTLVGASRDQKFLVPLKADVAAPLLEKTAEEVENVLSSRDDDSALYPMFECLQGCASLRAARVVIKPVVLYSIQLKEHHNFLITEKDIYAHNVGFVIPILIWGGGEVAWCGLGALFAAIGWGALRECCNHIFDSMARSHAEGRSRFGIVEREIYHAREKRQQQRQSRKSDKGGPSGMSDPNDKKPERKINTMTKTEFFHGMRDSYEYYRDGAYQLIKGASPILQGVKFLKWDHLHNEVEAYNKGTHHLGAIDPLRKIFCKAAERGRKLFD